MNPTPESLMAAYEAEGRRMGHTGTDANIWAETKLANRVSMLLDTVDRIVNASTDLELTRAYTEYRRRRRIIEQVLKAGEGDG